MSLMIKILSVLALILLAVVLLVLWVIVMPRHFWLEYCKADGAMVKMNIGPFKMRLYPLPDFLAKRKKKEPQPEKTQPEEKLPSQPAQTDTEPADNGKINPFADIQLSMNLVKLIVESVKGVMARIFKAIKFRDVSFTVPIHHSDVMKTQQIYGVVTNSFYSLAIFLQKHLQITFKSPLFVADFADRYKDSVYFYCQITASPILLLAAGWYGYKQYNIIMENNKKAPDATRKENNNG